MIHSRALGLTLVSSLFVLACGGGSAAEPAPDHGGSGGACAHHGGEGGCGAGCASEHHGEGDEPAGCACGHGRGAENAEVSALHSELGPVFHLEAGPGRAAAACEHASAFQSGSAAVETSTAPEAADAAAWSSATASLVAAANVLSAECSAAGPLVEERLIAFHAAFHALMEAAGGHEHGADAHH